MVQGKLLNCFVEYLQAFTGKNTNQKTTIHTHLISLRAK